MRLLAIGIVIILIYTNINTRHTQDDEINVRKTYEVSEIPRQAKSNYVLSEYVMDNYVRILYGESRKCYSDCYKVAQVINNRLVINGKGYETHLDVIADPKQFSSYRDKNFRSLKKNSNVYLKLRNIVIDVLAGNIPDTLMLPSGCVHFVNPSCSSWIPDENVVSISDNNHHYYYGN